MRSMMRFFQKHKLKTDGLSAQSGQTSVEYLIMLAILVGIAGLVIKQLVKPGYDKLAKALENRIQGQLLKADLHRYPMAKK